MAESKVKWTPAQQDAIDIDCDALLVSAAAGSGKTSVLTARILRKLTDLEHPLDLSQLLVVTYTKAAAKDLKKKIAKELRNTLSQNPNSEHLRRQILSLSTAQISTIHSFCFQLIRRYFHKLNLPGKLRIADEAEALLLYDSTMNDTVNAYYDGIYTDIDDFSSFADSFVTDRDENLPKKLIAWYKKFSTYIRGIDLLEDYASSLIEAQTIPFSQTRWGKQIKDFLLIKISDFLSIYQDACAIFAENETYQKKFVAFEQDLQILLSVQNLLMQDHFHGANATLMAYSEKFPAINRTSLSEELKTQELEFFKSAREAFKKWCKDAVTHLTICDANLTPIFLAKTAQYCRDLHSILSHFEEKLVQEKRQRGILDYTDLEHYTVALLYEKDGSYSHIAKELSAQYAEIFIDEYQDVNEIQDSIFRAIGESSRTFVVGDIKQSIYRFRGSEPSLFSHYRDQYPIYAHGSEAKKEQTLFLSNNFRCDRTVIETVNLIFSCLFRHNSGQVAYYDEDALVYSKKQENEPTPVQVTLIEAPPRAQRHNDDEEEEEDEPQSHFFQAAYIATEIRKLMQEGIQPGEIAILMRSMSSELLEQYESVFSQLQIPIQLPNHASLLHRPEIRLMTSLLRVLDNPASDIALTAVLLSPIFSFTLDELVEIRRTFAHESLYAALASYSEANESFEKGAFCINAIRQYREVALREPLDKTLWYLYRETGVLQFVYYGVEKAKGDAAKANLMHLYEYAKRFESSSYCGLYRFLLYIKDIMERDQALTEEEESKTENAVQVMTIHKSKGLEFKVCFVARCEKPMNTSDLRDELQFSYHLGVAPQLRDSNGVVIYQTPMASAVKFYQLQEQIDEEMRILYVALTRAKERLYITAQVSKLEEKMMLWRERAKKYISYSAFLSNTRYIDWCMLALYHAPENPCYEISIYQPHEIQALFDDSLQKLDATALEVEESAKADLDDEVKIQAYQKEFEERFRFLYPHQSRVYLPTKVSVSQLSNATLDHFDQFSGPFADQDVPLQEQPLFLCEQEIVADAAQRGTATHLFMQFADFDFAEKFGVDAERNRLIKQSFLTLQSAELVQLSAIEGFLKSDFYQNLWKNAEQIHREIRFNVKLPAADFTQIEEKKVQLQSESIFVQGIIDCLIQTANGYYLLDYKTDSFSDEMLSDPQAVADILRKRHQKQLYYYQIATKQLTGQDLSGAYLYSFALQDLVEMPLNESNVSI